MRHGKKLNHLGRTNTHRKAMMGNMATSLILHKRITTTLAKAKALRVYVEPLITKSKSDTTHSRRTVFSYLQDKDATSILFREIAEKVASRPGGYTRIIKMENRLGDNAEMAIIELVDYNTVYTKDSGTAVVKKSTRRRGSGKGVATTAIASAASAAVIPGDDAVVIDEPVAETPVTEESAAEAPSAENTLPEVAGENPEKHEDNAAKGE